MDIWVFVLMKKIVIFTQNLDVVGVQKSASTLVNTLSKYKKEIDLLCVE